MSVWRPSPVIKVKVLGLAWRGDELLLAEVGDDAGVIKGVRPLGGTIEFGETREQALEREFAEELNCPIRISGPWHGFENLFEHEGFTGHEFIFAANIMMGDTTLYSRDQIDFVEADLAQCRAGWYAPTRLPPGVDLYPTGLLPLIQAGTLRATS